MSFFSKHKSGKLKAHASRSTQSKPDEQDGKQTFLVCDISRETKV